MERPVSEAVQRSSVDHGPGHRADLQDVAPDLLRLLGLALQLEPPRFPLPLLPRRLLGSQLDVVPGLADGQERKERVAGIGLDHHQRLHRSRHGDVEGVHVELVGVEALVGLVAYPGVLQPALQVGRLDAGGALPELLGGAAHQIEEHHVLVLQPLGLLDREEERGGEGRPGRRLVLVAEHHHRRPRRAAGPRVELGAHVRAVGHELHPALLVADALDQVVALPVHRAEAPLLDEQQPVGERRYRPSVPVVGWQQMDPVEGRSPPRRPPSPWNRLFTRAQEKRLGCTIWLESPQSRKACLSRSVARASRSSTGVRSCTSSITRKS